MLAVSVVCQRQPVSGGAARCSVTLRLLSLTLLARGQTEQVTSERWRKRPRTAPRNPFSQRAKTQAGSNVEAVTVAAATACQLRFPRLEAGLEAGLSLWCQELNQTFRTKKTNTSCQLQPHQSTSGDLRAAPAPLGDSSSAWTLPLELPTQSTTPHFLWLFHRKSSETKLPAAVRRKS